MSGFKCQVDRFLDSVKHFNAKRELATMKKYFSIFLTLMCLFTFTTLTVYASDSQQQRPSLNERINNILLTPDGATNFYRFAFYLDAEGYVNVDKTVLDEIVSQIQNKLPYNATLSGDTQIIADLDLFREEKYDTLMETVEENNPEYTVLGTYDESGHKVKLTRKVLNEFFADKPYDGLIIVRINPVNVKTSYNIWWGGVDTKVEIDFIMRVFNKNTKKGYVFNNKQRLIGKSYSTLSSAPNRACRKAVPEALKNIKVISVE